MAYISFADRMKRVEANLATIVSLQDVDSLQRAERELLTAIRHQAIDARLEVRDYEYADTRAAQQAHAKAAKRFIETLRSHIVKASEYNIFGPVDVAQLTGELENIAAELT